jgi:hypothetical protein
VYRRVLINDMVAREAECRALVDAYRARAVCVANSLRCKIPHKKAFFAVLTATLRALFDGRSRRGRAARTWTRLRARPHQLRRRVDLIRAPRGGARGL